MADVQWIKIYTNMVSNKKIKRIRTLPEGNNIVLIWVFLLAQAGESNKNGALYLTDAIPFRAEDLAIEFDFELSIIQLALITLEKFSMIEVFEDIIYIRNWNEYQNIEGLDKIREQTRLRVEKYRGKQKLLPSNATSNATSNVTVTQGNATEEDKELDKEKDINNSGTSPRKYKIPPCLEEVKEYCKERNNNVDAVKWYDFYTSKAWMIGKNKMKDWKAAVRTWEGNKGKEEDKPKGTWGW
jgi:predicted phage replisome organizer